MVKCSVKAPEPKIDRQGGVNRKSNIKSNMFPYFWSTGFHFMISPFTVKKGNRFCFSASESKNDATRCSKWRKKCLFAEKSQWAQVFSNFSVTGFPFCFPSYKRNLVSTWELGQTAKVTAGEAERLEDLPEPNKKLNNFKGSITAFCFRIN